MKYDLAVVIPARNEMFLAQTVKSLIENKRGKTEIIVGLDGQWSNPPIIDHPDVTIFYSPDPLGQRGMTNQLVRLTRAKWVMKLDAHCTVDEGFDVKVIDGVQDDWTIIPAQYNLHAFDWVCIGKTERSGKLYVEDPEIKKLGCGHTIYQGPTVKCPKCGGNMERLLIWKPRLNKRSEFYRFDKTLHFQYWGDFKNRPEAQGDIAPSLSAQGSCFMLTRERYWYLDICDEGSAGKSGWGQQGVEVAMKTWLSGGQLMINKKTWYSHMFRTQGGDFGFPYPLSGAEQDVARNFSRDLWMNNKWKKALPGRTLEWLLNKFYPVPDWHDGKEIKVITFMDLGGNVTTKNIIFYTDNQLKLKYAHAVQKQLKKVGIPIVSASLKPMPNFGDNIHVKKERGLEAYFTQIISALEKSTADVVYMCEHDVIYHPSHFEFVPERKDIFYYNQNFWRIRPEVDNFAVHWDANQVSGLVCYRELLLDWYKKKWEKVQKEGNDRSYEPGNRDPNLIQAWKSKYPNIDIRHEGTMTRAKWSLNDFRDKSTSKGWEESTLEKIPGWDYNFLISLKS